MPRYLVELPENPIFTSHYRVVYTDINASQHLGADRIFPITAEVQFQFYKHIGLLDLLEQVDWRMLVANAQTDFMAESFHGDEIAIELGIANMAAKSFDLVYSLRKQGSEQEVARHSTRVLFINAESGRVRPVPEAFLELLTKL